MQELFSKHNSYSLASAMSSHSNNNATYLWSKSRCEIYFLVPLHNASFMVVNVGIVGVSDSE